MSFLDKLFSNLTKSAVTVDGQTSYSSDPSELAQMASQHIPSPAAMAGPDVLNPSAQSQVPLPSQITKPSFTQASHNSLGMPDATGPGLNKAGKLMTVLFSGLAGAAAGAGQRTVGEGFASGSQLPFIQAHQKQQLQQGQLQNQMLQNQVQYAPLLQRLGILKTQSEIGKDAATTNKTNAETANMPIEAALKQAQTEAANYKEDPNMGLIDLRTKQPVNSSAIAPLTADEAAVLGKQPGERVPIKLKNTANEIVNRGLTTTAGENDTFVVNKANATKTPLGVGSPRIAATLARPVQVMDPNDPGNVTYASAGQAMKQGMSAPSSAPAVTAKATARAVAPGGKVGEEVNAFNTAIAHADLLMSAAASLQNGDQQTLAGLKNRFKNEFGYEGPITASAIADAYTHEVQKMLSGGHVTDAEIGRVGKTLDPNKQNMATVSSVVGAYKALAQSKMQQRQRQVEQGMKGKADFPTENNTDPLGIR